MLMKIITTASILLSLVNALPTQDNDQLRTQLTKEYYPEGHDNQVNIQPVNGHYYESNSNQVSIQPVDGDYYYEEDSNEVSIQPVDGHHSGANNEQVSILPINGQQSGSSRQIQSCRYFFNNACHQCPREFFWNNRCHRRPFHGRFGSHLPAGCDSGINANLDLDVGELLGVDADVSLLNPCRGLLFVDADVDMPNRKPTVVREPKSNTLNILPISI